MKPRQSLPHLGRGVALFSLLTAGGCITMETREEQVRQEQQQIGAQQEMTRLKTQVESLLAQQEQLQQQLQQLRALSQDRVTASDLQQAQNQTMSQVQSRLADLDRKLAALDGARAQDKQDIINTLSRNLSAAMAAGARPGGRSAPSAAKSGGAPAFSGKAFEHVVATGDTLSAIASAYKVSASAIISANNLKDPGHLKVGQKLLIPAP